MATTTSQINEIKEDLSDAYTALGAKGATLPASNARGSANLASTVATVPSPDYPNVLWSAYSTTTGHSQGGVSSTTFYDLPSFTYSKLCKGMEISCDVSFRDTVYFSASEAFMNTTKPAGSQGYNFTFPSMTTGMSGQNYSSFGRCFYNSTAIKTLSFPELTQKITADSMCYGCTSLTSVSFPKLETISVYQNGFNSAFKGCTSLTSVDFSSLQSISASYSSQDASKAVFGETFRDCTSLTSVSFPALTTVSTSGECIFNSTFKDCTSLTSVSFPELTSMGSGYSWGNVFEGCSALTSISFPKLTAIFGGPYGGFINNCASLTSLSFPSVTQLSCSNTMNSIFGGLPLLSSLDLSHVETLRVAGYMFSSLPSLTTLSFPALTSFTQVAVYPDRTFNSCNNLVEIHFPAAMQSTIEACSAYQSKFGASNATIYFDL